VRRRALLRHLEALTDRALVLAERYERRQDVTSLEEAIHLFTEVVERGDQSVPDRARHLDNLGVALLTRYEAGHRTTDLHEALRLARKATGPTVPHHDDRPLHLSNHCNVALRAYDETQDPSVLAEAITAGTEAVSTARSNDPDLPLYQTNLQAAVTARFERRLRESATFAARYEQDGSSHSLDAAIAAGRAAIAGASDDPRLWLALSNTSNLLRLRFETVGEEADLEDCVSLAREATGSVARLAAAEAAQADIRGAESSCAANLSAALLMRFFHGNAVADADEVVALCRRAADGAVDPETRALLLSNLIGALQGRASDTADPLAARADLDEAVDVSRQLAATASAPLDRAVYLGNLANALLSRAWAAAAVPDRHEQVQRDVDEAIMNADEAARALPAGGQDWARTAANLATACSTRWELVRDQDDAARACHEWRAIAEATSVAVSVRIAAARDAAGLAARALVPGIRLPMAAAAVELLPLLAWPGLAWRSRALQLSRWPGLASDAAAAAVAERLPETAIVLAEHGRAVLWGRLLDLRRDLAAISWEDPELAGRLVHIRQELDRGLGQPNTAAIPERRSAG
jgi:hypothetical protein